MSFELDEKYQSRLKKEFSLHPPLRTGIKRIEGISIEIPMVYKDVKTIMYFLTADADKVNKYINNKNIKPVLIFRNKTVLAINVFEYKESAVGTFNEFTFSIPVMLGAKFSVPIFPLILDQIFNKFGFYVLQLGASSNLGRKHIEEIWGYPTYKNNLEINLGSDGADVTASIKENDKKILGISETLLDGGSNYKFAKKKFKTYFTSGHELRSVKLDVFTYYRIWIGERNFKIETGNHEISSILKQLNIGKKLATIFYPNAIEIAGEALPI